MQNIALQTKLQSQHLLTTIEGLLSAIITIVHFLIFGCKTKHTGSRIKHQLPTKHDLDFKSERSIIRSKDLSVILHRAGLGHGSSIHIKSPGLWHFSDPLFVGLTLSQSDGPGSHKENEKEDETEDCIGIKVYQSIHILMNKSLNLFESYTSLAESSVE